MSKKHGWDDASIKNYEADAEDKARLSRIADYHQRRKEIDRRHSNEDHFIAVHNLAHEFSDLVEEDDSCPIEEITNILNHSFGEAVG